MDNFPDMDFGMVEVVLNQTDYFEDLFVEADRWTQDDECPWARTFVVPLSEVDNFLLTNRDYSSSNVEDFSRDY